MILFFDKEACVSGAAKCRPLILWDEDDNATKGVSAARSRQSRGHFTHGSVEEFKRRPRGHCV